MNLPSAPTADEITAIAGLWKLIAVVAAFVALVYFRKPLFALMQELTRFTLKRGKTEIGVERQSDRMIQPGTIVIGETVQPELPPADGQHDLPPPDSGEPFSSMLDAFVARDLEKASKEFARLQSAEVDAVKRLRSECLYCYFRYIWANEASALRRLEAIADTKEIRSSALGWIARCHEHAGAYEKAAVALRAAIEAAATEHERATHIASLSRVSLAIGNHAESIAIASQGLRSIQDENSRGVLYRALAAAFKESGDKFSHAVALEKALEIEPEDVKLRFEAAYAQSESDLQHISIANYSVLLRQSPENSMALNNLGVAAGQLAFPIRSVEFYRSAAKHNETLAMANLAYLLLEKGFAKDAHELLVDAQRQEVIHPNVGRAFSDLAQRQEEESGRWKAVLDAGAKHGVYIQAFAEARFIPEDKSDHLLGLWAAADGQRLKIEIKNGALVGEGQIQSKRRRLEGTVSNRTARFRVKTWQPSIFDAESGNYDIGVPGLAYVTRDGAKLRLAFVVDSLPVVLDFDQVRET